MAKLVLIGEFFLSEFLFIELRLSVASLTVILSLLSELQL